MLLGAALATLLGACGARTGQLPPWLTDGGSVKVDAPRADGPQRDGWRPPDQRQPADTFVHDACLPIPASQVQGKYSGTWKGSWKCPGMSSLAVNGTLYFHLTPSGSAESFKVVGAMKGTISGTSMPFSTTINGSMGCTALSAALPDILVGSGGLMIQLTGSIMGAFMAPPGDKPGFPNGSWSAKETGSSSCKASGSWGAAQ